MQTNLKLNKGEIIISTNPSRWGHVDEVIEVRRLLDQSSLNKSKLAGKFKRMEDNQYFLKKDDPQPKDKNDCHDKIIMYLFKIVCIV